MAGGWGAKTYGTVARRRKRCIANKEAAQTNGVSTAACPRDGPPICRSFTEVQLKQTWIIARKCDTRQYFLLTLFYGYAQTADLSARRGNDDDDSRQPCCYGKFPRPGVSPRVHR